ncbi:MAG: alpha/beta hydrolase [Deltaproteobacteria bacterium]|nr:alpha/beta hydrolase [Deltaproteobacteria bacterium]
MPHVSIKDENIFYELNDSNAGPSLILIHGSGGDHTHWPPALRNLSSAGVYALDLPGHGNSSGTGRRNVDEYADVVERFIHSLNLSSVILAGHSLGGAIAQTLALRAPEWLTGLILVGTGARLRVVPEFLQGFRTDFQAAAQALTDWLFSDTTPIDLKMSTEKKLLATDPDVVIGDFTACAGFDIMDRVSEIHLPTLVISADKDKLTPIKYGQFLCEQIRDAQHTIIGGAGHMMALEASEAFVQAIGNFIESHKAVLTPLSPFQQ